MPGKRRRRRRRVEQLKRIRSETALVNCALPREENLEREANA